MTAADTTALQAPSAAQRPRGRRKDLRRNWLGPLFLSPAALLFVLFIGGPFVVAIVLSIVGIVEIGDLGSIIPGASV